MALVAAAEGSAAPEWAGYDEVAEAYERFVAANGLAALARDLVTLLGLSPGASMLDVGCGTGAATRVAQEAVGARGLVVGLDVSLAMLRRASAQGGGLLVAGAAAGLPFRDRLFDRVASSLVLSHLASYETALGEMMRVLKGTGWLGVTAGARNPNPPNLAYRVWEETAESFVGRGALRAAAGRVVPHEAWLTDASHVATALTSVGLEGVEIHEREYPVTMPIDDYLSMLDLFAYGRFLRWSLRGSRWREFRGRVEEVVRARCSEPIEYTGHYHLGIGRKP